MKQEEFSTGDYILGALEFGAAIAAAIIAVSSFDASFGVKLVIGIVVFLVSIFTIAYIDGSLRG